MLQTCAGLCKVLVQIYKRGKDHKKHKEHFFRHQCQIQKGSHKSDRARFHIKSNNNNTELGTFGCGFLLFMINHKAVDHVKDKSTHSATDPTILSHNRVQTFRHIYNISILPLLVTACSLCCQMLLRFG